MKFTKKVLPAVLFLFCLVPTLRAQQINTDAVHAFWKVVDLMKAGKPLTDSVWDAYFSLYGNRVYMKNNRGDFESERHRRYLELVFRPSFADSLKKVAAEKNAAPQEDIFQNLYYIKEHEAVLRTYASVITAPDYLPGVLQLAKKYLPLKEYNPVPPNLTIYLMAMASDAAVQDSSMYYGIAIVYGYDRFLKGAIPAHEFSHLLRKQKPVTGILSARDSASFTAVDEINNEGCADLIDKTVLVAHADSIIRGGLGKKKFLGNPELAVRQLDTAIADNEPGGNGSGTPERFNRITRYSSGHIPGFFMVRIIAAQGYLPALIAGCDNPFNFFYLYNAAAAKDAAHPPLFSKKTMSELQRLEKLSYP